MAAAVGVFVATRAAGVVVELGHNSVAAAGFVGEVRQSCTVAVAVVPGMAAVVVVHLVGIAG